MLVLIRLLFPAQTSAYPHPPSHPVLSYSSFLNSLAHPTFPPLQILLELYTRVRKQERNFKRAFILGGLYGLVECTAPRVLLAVARVVLAVSTAPPVTNCSTILLHSSPATRHGQQLDWRLQTDLQGGTPRAARWTVPRERCAGTIDRRTRTRLAAG